MLSFDWVWLRQLAYFWIIFVPFEFCGIVLCRVYYVVVVCYLGVVVLLLFAIVVCSLVVVAIDIGTSFCWLVHSICLFLVLVLSFIMVWIFGPNVGCGGEVREYLVCVRLVVVFVVPGGGELCVLWVVVG